jgi:hypothetical protein
MHASLLCCSKLRGCRSCWACKDARGTASVRSPSRGYFDAAAQQACLWVCRGTRRRLRTYSGAPQRAMCSPRAPWTAPSASGTRGACPHLTFHAAAQKIFWQLRFLACALCAACRQTQHALLITRAGRHSLRILHCMPADRACEARLMRMRALRCMHAGRQGMRGTPHATCACCVTPPGRAPRRS